MSNFSLQAHNEKVTDCHALFRILRFFELGCFLGRNIDLGGSFPTHDLKFGQRVKTLWAKQIWLLVFLQLIFHNFAPTLLSSCDFFLMVGWGKDVIENPQ